MAFEIIIKQNGIEKKLVGGDWTKIDESFYSVEDIEKLQWMQKEKIEAANFNEAKKSVMGYAPQTEKLVPFEKEIFRQSVDELNLTTVVKAVNNLL